MPSNKTISGPNYTVWIDGIERGSAYELLERIRERADSKALQELTTEGYAKLLISDAAFFLPKDLLEFLRKQQYDSDYDRALRYLSEMPNSGVRILTMQPQ